MSKPSEFLDRCMLQGPYLQLCLSQDEFDSNLDYFKQSRRRWVTEGKIATQHFLGAGDDGSPVCVVCLDLDRCRDFTPIEVACLLVHEAVHVWQTYRDHIGEDRPSHEFEAYSIQAISLRLMDAYASRVVG